jgi:hypothetical protein
MDEKDYDETLSFYENEVEDFIHLERDEIPQAAYEAYIEEKQDC